MLARGSTALRRWSWLRRTATARSRNGRPRSSAQQRRLKPDAALRGSKAPRKTRSRPHRSGLPVGLLATALGRKRLSNCFQCCHADKRGRGRGRTGAAGLPKRSRHGVRERWSESSTPVRHAPQGLARPLLKDRPFRICLIKLEVSPPDACTSEAHGVIIRPLTPLRTILVATGIVTEMMSSAIRRSTCVPLGDMQTTPPDKAFLDVCEPLVESAGVDLRDSIDLVSASSPC